MSFKPCIVLRKHEALIYSFVSYKITLSSCFKGVDKLLHKKRDGNVGIGSDSLRTTMFNIVLQRNRTHGERWVRGIPNLSGHFCFNYGLSLAMHEHSMVYRLDED